MKKFLLSFAIVLTFLTLSHARPSVYAGNMPATPVVPMSAYRQLFWGNDNDNKVEALGTDGTGRRNVANNAAPGGSSAFGIAVDGKRNKVYWFEDGTSSIIRANLDGTAQETLATDLGYVYSMSFDPVADRLYWADTDNKLIESAAWDGSGRKVFLGNADTKTAVATDPLQQVIYWYSQGSGSIYRAKPDGSDLRILVANVGYTYALQVDAQTGLLYWADNENNKIGIVSTAGSGESTLITTTKPPIGMALDPLNNQLFWSEDQTNTIYRANLDGSGIAAFATGTGTAYSINVAFDYGLVCPDQQLAASDVSAAANQTSGVTTTYGINCETLIAAVASSGANPVAGLVTAKVWIEDAQPASYVKRHYELTPSSEAATATGLVTLYFTNQEFLDFNTANTLKLPANTSDASGKANLRIEKRSGTSSDNSGSPESYSAGIETIDPADENIVWNAAEARWEVTFEVAGFSGFFVKTQTAPLPVRLLSFSAKYAEHHALLTWRIADAVNFSHFDIEQSRDGKMFTKLARVDYIASQQEYAFTDQSTTGNSLQYYRLKLADQDGSHAYSQMIALRPEAAALLAYPNPARNMLNIDLLEAGSASVRLTAGSGQVILVEKVKSVGGKATVNLGDRVKPGIYIVSIEVNGLTTVRKIVVE